MQMKLLQSFVLNAVHVHVADVGSKFMFRRDRSHQRGQQEDGHGHDIYIYRSCVHAIRSSDAILPLRLPSQLHSSAHDQRKRNEPIAYHHLAVTSKVTAKTKDSVLLVISKQLCVLIQIMHDESI